MKLYNYKIVFKLKSEQHDEIITINRIAHDMKLETALKYFEMMIMHDYCDGYVEVIIHHIQKEYLIGIIEE